METRSIELNICQVCNWGCPSCNRFCDLFRDTADDTIMSVSEVQGILDEINKELKVATFTIIGGEPTLHPECEAICRLVCEKMADNSTRIEVATNNSRQEVVSRLRGIPGLAIRVDNEGGMTQKCRKHWNFYDVSSIQNSRPIDHRTCEYVKCGIAIFKHRGRIRWFQCPNAQFLARVLDVEDTVCAYSLHDLLTTDRSEAYGRLCRYCYQQPEYLKSAPRNFGVVSDVFRAGYEKILKEALSAQGNCRAGGRSHGMAPYRTAYVYVTDGNAVEEKYRRHSISTLVRHVPGAHVFTLTGGKGAISAEDAGWGRVVNIDDLFAAVYGPGRIDGRSGGGVLPAIVFGRLLCTLIPELDGFERFVYIDSDTEVASPFFAALEYIPVAAQVSGVVDVSRPWAVKGCDQVKRCAGIDMSPDNYINTGVLLMQRASDRDAWISECRRAFDLDARCAFQSADQEAINAVFSPGRLPNTFNYQCSGPDPAVSGICLYHYSGNFKKKRQLASVASDDATPHPTSVPFSYTGLAGIGGDTANISQYSPFFGHVDQVVVQTCTRYPARRYAIVRELRRVGITNPHIRVQPDSPILSDGLRGRWVDRVLANIWFSHYMAVRYCYDMGYERVLLLEDDAVFIRELDLMREALGEVDVDYSIMSLDPIVVHGTYAQHDAAVRRGADMGLGHWGVLYVGDTSASTCPRCAGCRILSRAAIGAYVKLHERVFAGQDSNGSTGPADLWHYSVMQETGRPMLYAHPPLSIQGLSCEVGRCSAAAQIRYAAVGVNTALYGDA